MTQNTTQLIFTERILRLLASKKFFWTHLTLSCLGLFVLSFPLGGEKNFLPAGILCISFILLGGKSNLYTLLHLSIVMAFTLLVILTIKVFPDAIGYLVLLFFVIASLLYIVSALFRKTFEFVEICFFSTMYMTLVLLVFLAITVPRHTILYTGGHAEYVGEQRFMFPFAR